MATISPAPVRARERARPRVCSPGEPGDDWRDVTAADLEQVMDHRRLASQLLAGSEAALEDMYRRWSPLVFRIAAQSLGSRVDADDITQQVFVSAWRSRSSIDPSRITFPAWLITITRRRVADELERRSRENRRVAAVAAEATPKHAPPASDVIDRLVVADELSKMDDPRRTILKRAFEMEQTHEEIAREMRIPLGTVKSHVRRGLRHLAGRLEDVRG